MSHILSVLQIALSSAGQRTVYKLEDIADGPGSAGTGSANLV